MSHKKINTRQVGQLFNVDESTVRRWAISGKIKCSTSAGGHRKFSYKNIIDFSNEYKLNLKSKFDIDIFDSSISIDKILSFMLDNHIQSIENILIQLYLKGIGLSAMMDDYIDNVLKTLQKKLDNEKVSVAEEHIARKVLSKSLNNFKDYISPEKAKNEKQILCLNLENDIPDLPIDMIQILLESINYSVHNCGSHTSISNIRSLLSTKIYKGIFIYLCDRQCCTSTVNHNIANTNKDLRIISDLAQRYNIKLFLGGPSFINIDENIIKNYILFSKYADVLKLVRYL